LRRSLVVVDAWLWFVSDKQPVFNVDTGIMCINVRTTELCILYLEDFCHVLSKLYSRTLVLW